KGIFWDGRAAVAFRADRGIKVAPAAVGAAKPGLIIERRVGTPNDLPSNITEITSVACMSEPAVANFSGHIEFAQPFDIDQTANVIDTILVPALQRLGFDDDKLWTVSITGLENNPAAEAKVIAALEAEAAAIEAERQ